MSDTAVSRQSVQIPSTRAQVMSAVRVTLHVAVVVALGLTLAGVNNLSAIVVGVILGLGFATRSRRIGVRFSPKGVAVSNYFKDYMVEDLQGSRMKLYLRNRTELETPGQASFHIQAATLMSLQDFHTLQDEMEARGATVSSPASGVS